MIFTSPWFQTLRSAAALKSRTSGAFRCDHEPMPTLPLSPDEMLTTTRSVRKRLDLTRPVPLDLVRECLEVALQAPSGSNRQGWHWMVLTDKSVIKRR
jgi:Nitroreductase family